MSEPVTLRERFDRLQRLCFAVGALGLAASAFGFTQDRAAFFQGWLIALLYWIAIPLGSLALSMLHHLTGGSWGFTIRRLLEAATRTLPLFVLLFVPLAFGLHELYEWTHADVVAADPLLQHKAPYLNTTGFLVRAGVYFAVWLGLATLLNRWAERNDRLGGSEKLVTRMRAISGPGLLLYALTMTFAAVDWAMSLEPHWFSTIYGVIFIVGQALATLAFSIAVSAWISRREPFTRWMKPGHYHDLGKLMFAFVLLWAYTNFSQFLIIWSGNLAEEAPWYLRRTEGDWKLLAQALIALHFALPFLVLLSKHVKRNALALAGTAVFLLAMRLVDLYWLVIPAFHGGEAHFHWLHLAAPIGVGGLWLGVFVQQLKGRPLVSLEDAQLERTLEGAGAAAQHHA